MLVRGKRVARTTVWFVLGILIFTLLAADDVFVNFAHSAASIPVTTAPVSPGIDLLKSWFFLRFPPWRFACRRILIGWVARWRFLDGVSFLLR